MFVYKCCTILHLALQGSKVSVSCYTSGLLEEHFFQPADMCYCDGPEAKQVQRLGGKTSACERGNTLIFSLRAAEEGHKVGASLRLHAAAEGDTGPCVRDAGKALLWCLVVPLLWAEQLMGSCQDRFINECKDRSSQRQMKEGGVA